MPKSENKTAPTVVPVAEFLAAQSEARQADCAALNVLLERIVGEPPRMWGPSVVGFGSYHYRYESGRGGDSALAGYSPRKANLVVYVMAGFERWPELMARLGRYTTGSSCLYLKRLADVDLAVLEELMVRSVAHVRERYPRN